MRTLLVSSAEGTTDRDASMMPMIPANILNQDVNPSGWEEVKK